MAVSIRGGKGGGAFSVSLPAIGLFEVPEKARAIMRALDQDHLDLALQTIRGEVAERTPSDTGTASRGWQTDILAGASRQGGADSVLGGRVFNTIPHAIVLDQGRRPGFGVSRAGQAGIARWVRRVLGLAGKDAERATRAIVWKIRAKGLPARRFVATGLEAARPALNGIDRSLAEAYAVALGSPGGSKGRA